MNVVWGLNIFVIYSKYYKINQITKKNLNIFDWYINKNNQNAISNVIITWNRNSIMKKISFNCSLLKPSYDRQIEVLTSAISEIIWRCAGGFSVSTCPNVVSNIIPKAIVALPQDTPYLQHSVQYFQDGLTETVYFPLRIFSASISWI